MKIGVNLDFNNTYEIEYLSGDLQFFQFTSFIEEGEELLLKIEINISNNIFLPNVFNLGFGPIKEDGTIDDRIAIRHTDRAKVYSTLLLGTLTFLRTVEANVLVGIDGSDKIRAYLYYRLLQNNYDYLTQYFRLIGVKYYVRLLRGNLNTDPYSADLKMLPHIRT